MIQLSDCPGLPFEAFIEGLVRNLESDKAVQARVQGAVDLSHAAGAKRRLDSVGTELSAGCGLFPRARRHGPLSSAEDKQNPGRAQPTRKVIKLDTLDRLSASIRQSTAPATARQVIRRVNAERTSSMVASINWKGRVVRRCRERRR
jgi:hypothetical protein